MQFPEIQLYQPSYQPIDIDLPFPHAQASDLVGTWRIQGVAGSGKTSILAATVARAVALGIPAREILVITPSKETASFINAEITARLRGTSFIGEANFAYSIHAIAFGLLRTCIQRDPSLPFDSDVRLISGPEQDVVIRQLLGEIAADDQARMQWPREVQDALDFSGFARELRDFMLRAYERGIGPEELRSIGEDVAEPLWVAIANFMAQYEEISALAGSENVSASELLSTVVKLPLPEMPWKYILVDDAQHLDPKSGELLDTLRTEATFSVVCGDPEQTIFQFRGASSAWFEQLICQHEVNLVHSHRIASIQRQIAPSQKSHDDAIAATLRRTHLKEKVPWSQMCVIVRSTGDIPQLRRSLLAAGVPVYTDGTALVLAEEPIVAELFEAVSAAHHVQAYAQAWLAYTGTDADDAGTAVQAAQLAQLRRRAYATVERLGRGQLVGIEPLVWQGLVRMLRRNAHKAGMSFADAGADLGLDMLCLWVAELTTESDAAEPQSRRQIYTTLLDLVRAEDEPFLKPLAQLRAVIQAPVGAAGVEQVLWRIWSTANIARNLQNLSIQGGAIGSQADRTLDAVMALFDIAANWVERRPGGTMSSFQRYLIEQELPAGVRERATSSRDAVRLVTAHGVSGHEWHTVILAQVQEQVWPAFNPQGTLLKREAFVDYCDRGIHPDTYIARTAEQLRSEENLFHVALTRASDAVVVLAIDDEHAKIPLVPSRFLHHLHPAEEVLGAAEQLHQDHSDAIDMRDDVQLGEQIRVLSAPNLVAELRRVLAMDIPEQIRQQALRQLARLATAGVPGADPQQWWGKQPSSTASVPQSVLSPSTVEEALTCPLRGALKNAFPSNSTESILAGNIVHKAAEAITTGLPHDAVVEAASSLYASCLNMPQWWRNDAIKTFRETLRCLALWLSKHTDTAKLVEIPVNVEIPVPTDEDANAELLAGTASEPVVIKGRIDRLLETKDGYTVIDFKTSKSPKTKKQAEENPQLRTYQVALEHGELYNGEIRTGTGLPTAGACLVYPARRLKGGVANERFQSALDAESSKQWTHTLFELRDQLTATDIAAVESSECSHCPILPMCPAKTEGASLLS
ncbi:MAG: PD-(D/E)XK nuclease family protein [Corynebacterium sp.]|nr:PD-(D/E)XK nuclease family protein [Corynebacterium sp.]